MRDDMFLVKLFLFPYNCVKPEARRWAAQWQRSSSGYKGNTDTDEGVTVWLELCTHCTQVTKSSHCTTIGSTMDECCMVCRVSASDVGQQRHYTHLPQLTRHRREPRSINLKSLAEACNVASRASKEPSRSFTITGLGQGRLHKDHNSWLALRI